MSLSWIPLYEELATALLAYEDRQAELIALLAQLKKDGLTILPLVDRTKTGTRQMEVIDPFTFFAAFNRSIKTATRIAILDALKTKLTLKAPVPSDFESIPIVDNQASWFFPYATVRDAGDIPALWRLAREVLTKNVAEIDATAFDRCRAIKGVGDGKLTMGLYWVRPRLYLPLDRRTRELLEAKGIDPVLPDDDGWAAYLRVLRNARERVGQDFPAISMAAYQATSSQKKKERYWVGGFMFGDQSQLDRFLSENIWELGHSPGSTKTTAKKAVERFAQVQVGDLFGIKGLGGRYQLRVHRVARVKAIDAKKQRLELDNLPKVRLYRGRAPNGPGVGTWFESLAQVTEPDAIAAVFEGEGGGTIPPPPDEQTLPLNLILHGPPGTGKTWALANEIRPTFAVEAQAEAPGFPDVAGLTWFQIVALALDEIGPCDVPTLLEHPLIQAKHAERAIQTRPSAIVWGQLQSHTVESSKTVKYTRRIHPLVFDRDEEGRWLLVDGLPEDLELLRPGDAPEAAPENEFFITFHPSFTYEDFVEGMRPEGVLEDESSVRYVVRPGIFKQACDRAVQLTGFTAGLDAFCRLAPDARRQHLADATPVVLLIDEINRGNVARILGELITLIEHDKRLGAANEIIVTLPGSRQRFGVPPNLWIVATMNTADRSVVALDTALRRRFAFREYPPRSELLDGVIAASVNIRSLLDAINARLLRLRDRDHLIGHAFFMPMKDDPKKRSLDELRRVFREAIVPLLCEYFYDDLGRVGLVLGPDFVHRDAASSDIFAKGFEHDQRDDLADRPTYRLADVDALAADVFRRIYG